MNNDKKIILAKLSLEKNPDDFSIQKNSKSFSLEERLHERILNDFIKQVRRENHDLIPINEEHQIQIFKALIEASLMHVSKEEKCIELTPEKLRKLKFSVEDLMIWLKKQPSINQIDYDIKTGEALLKKLESLANSKEKEVHG